MLRYVPIFRTNSPIFRLKNMLSQVILATAIGVAGLMTATDQPMQMSSVNINVMDVIQAIINP